MNAVPRNAYNGVTTLATVGGGALFEERPGPLDGTADQEIPGATVEALADWREQGKIAIWVDGRSIQHFDGNRMFPHQDFRQVTDRLTELADALVLENGGMVWWNPQSPGAQAAQNAGGEWMQTASGMVVCEWLAPRMSDEHRAYFAQSDLYPNWGSGATYSAAQVDVPKGASSREVDRLAIDLEAHINADLKAKGLDTMYTTERHHENVMLEPIVKGVVISKSTGLQHVADRLGINLATQAVGVTDTVEDRFPDLCKIAVAPAGSSLAREWALGQGASNKLKAISWNGAGAVIPEVMGNVMGTPGMEQPGL
ncbi:MAG: hypothetical protein ACR2GX_01650 [Candidatus Dormibacteria bacterium]